MGYFSELEITDTQRNEKTSEASHLESLNEWLCYLEDKLDSVESGKTEYETGDSLLWDAVPLYDYDEPNTAYGLRIAIRNVKEKIEAEYDKNMRMLEWRLSVLLNGETPEGQLAFTDVFSFAADAA